MLKDFWKRRHPSKSAAETAPPAKGLRIEAWQAIIVAVIAAFGAVVVAVINMSGSGSGSTSSSGPSPGWSRTKPTVAITNWTERLLPPPPGKTFEFQGTVSPKDDHGEIFVVAEETDVSAPAYGTRPWLVSPEATYPAPGLWVVRWDLPDPPTIADWKAVVMESCPGGGVCGPPGFDARDKLTIGGPNSGSAVSSPVPVRPTPR